MQQCNQLLPRSEWTRAPPVWTAATDGGLCPAGIATRSPLAVGSAQRGVEVL